MNRRPRIGIPMPHSLDLEYAHRAIPQYESAVEMAGGEPVRIALDLSTEAICKLLADSEAVLLPGSNADIDPTKFKADRSPRTAPADPRRDAVDALLLRDAYENRKPILGICYGLQSLNVFREGSLIQHIPDFLPEDLRGKVNHEAGKTVAVAHTVEVESDSQLSNALGRSGNLPVNSSHHQAAEVVGTGLRVVARCAEDGVIEAIEGTPADHFVIAVQWHPERSVDEDSASRAIFHAFVEAAKR
jgi:putative glutamine amidotransferase